MPRIKWEQHRDELTKLVAEKRGVREIAAIIGAKEAATWKGLKSLGLRIDQDALRERRRETMRRTQRQFRAEHAAAMRTPLYRQKRREIALRLHADPEFRKKTFTAQREALSKPEVRERVKAAVIAGIKKYQKRKQAEKAEQQHLSRLTGFERQLYLARTGRAQVVRNVRFR